MTNTNYEKEQLNWEGQLEIKLKDGKNLVNNWYLKNQPQGGKTTYEYKVSYTKLFPDFCNLDDTGFTNQCRNFVWDGVCFLFKF